MRCIQIIMTKLQIILMTLLTATVLTFTGCDDHKDLGDHMEDAGDTVEDAADNTGDAIEDAADDTHDAIKDATN